jgi:hypothetical protein
VGVPIKGFRQNGGGSALPAIERINAFAGFDFSKFAEEREPFSFGKSSDGSTLSFDAETRTALAKRGSRQELVAWRQTCSGVYKLHTTVCGLYVGNTEQCCCSFANDCRRSECSNKPEGWLVR